MKNNHWKNWLLAGFLGVLLGTVCLVPQYKADEVFSESQEDPGEETDFLTGRTFEFMYLDEIALVQGDGGWYYYSFTPADAGDYTFYLVDQADTASLMVVDQHGYQMERLEGSYSGYMTEYPASYTVHLAAEQTAILEVSSYSWSQSALRASVREYEAAAELELTSLSLDKTTISSGEDAYLTLGLPDVPVSYVRFQYGENCYSRFLNGSVPDGGTITVPISGLPAGAVYDLSGLVILNEYGMPYSVSYANVSLEDVRITVPSLQEQMNALAADGGGSLWVSDSIYLYDTLTVPEGVSLHLTNGIYMGDEGVLQVNGEIFLQEYSDGFTNIHGAIHKGDNGKIRIFYSACLYPSGSGEFLTSVQDLTGTYRAVIYQRNNSEEDIAQWQWRRGSWRSENAPTEEETVVIENPMSFTEEYSSEELNGDELWYKFTVPAEMERGYAHVVL